MARPAVDSRRALLGAAPPGAAFRLRATGVDEALPSPLPVAPGIETAPSPASPPSSSSSSSSSAEPSLLPSSYSGAPPDASVSSCASPPRAAASCTRNLPKAGVRFTASSTAPKPPRTSHTWPKPRLSRNITTTCAASTGPNGSARAALLSVSVSESTSSACVPDPSTAK